MELLLTQAKLAAQAIPFRYSWPSLESMRAQASCRSLTSMLSLFIAFSIETRASVATWWPNPLDPQCTMTTT